MRVVIRSLAVRHIKPLLSDRGWQSLRHLSRRAIQRDARTAVADAEQRAHRAQCDAADARAALAALSLTGPSLTDLAKKYGTDKWGKKHRYTPHYEYHLSHLRGQRFTLLEIGIGGYKRAGRGGASLRMWQEYFPRANIFGLDIEDKSFVNGDRITTYQGSQADPDILRRIVDDAEDLRVVIDDGSHRNQHILASFQTLFPLLPTNAYYVIEDIQTSYWPRYGGSTDPTVTGTSIGLFKQLLDDVNFEAYTNEGYEPTNTQRHVVGLHAYKNLLFIDKGLNNEGRVPLRHD